MPGHLPQALVKERAFKLREQSKVIKEAYIKKQFGKDFDVLWGKTLQTLLEDVLVVHQTI